MDGSDNVTVQPGAVVIPGNAVSGTGCYRTALSAATTNALAARDAVNGRIDLMQGNPEDALEHLDQTVRLSKDPRTIAWAHIYLGRMYDIAQTPQRDKAVAEYKAALASRDSQPDTKAAAEKGLKQPFALPKRTTPSSDGQEELDPTGKAEKEAYRPSQPK